MKTNKANKVQINNELLDRGDSLLVADSLGVCKDFVNKIRRGERGKRKTTIQEAVAKALNKRAKQNQELIEYCTQLRVNLVIPQ